MEKISLMVAYIKAVAVNLNDQQRNIVLTGIAAVISADVKVNRKEKAAYVPVELAKTKAKIFVYDKFRPRVYR